MCYFMLLVFMWFMLIFIHILRTYSNQVEKMAQILIEKVEKHIFRKVNIVGLDESGFFFKILVVVVYGPLVKMNETRSVVVVQVVVLMGV